jgi:hypothetical protein
MIERPTKKLKTPSGKEVEIKEYLTARERNELRNVFLENMKVDATGDQPSVKEISGTAVELAEKKLIELAVASYDGSAEKILDRLLDATPDEYDFVVREANKINTGNFQPAK